MGGGSFCGRGPAVILLLLATAACISAAPAVAMSQEPWGNTLKRWQEDAAAAQASKAPKGLPWKSRAPAAALQATMPPAAGAAQAAAPAASSGDAAASKVVQVAATAPAAQQPAKTSTTPAAAAEHKRPAKQAPAAAAAAVATAAVTPAAAAKTPAAAGPGSQPNAKASEPKQASTPAPAQQTTPAAPAAAAPPAETKPVTNPAAEAPASVAAWLSVQQLPIRPRLNPASAATASSSSSSGAKKTHKPTSGPVHAARHALAHGAAAGIKPATAGAKQHPARKHLRHGGGRVAAAAVGGGSAAALAAAGKHSFHKRHPHKHAADGGANSGETDAGNTYTDSTHKRPQKPTVTKHEQQHAVLEYPHDKGSYGSSSGSSSSGSSGIHYFDSEANFGSGFGDGQDTHAHTGDGSSSSSSGVKHPGPVQWAKGDPKQLHESVHGQDATDAEADGSDDSGKSDDDDSAGSATVDGGNGFSDSGSASSVTGEDEGPLIDTGYEPWDTADAEGQEEEEEAADSEDIADLLFEEGNGDEQQYGNSSGGSKYNKNKKKQHKQKKGSSGNNHVEEDGGDEDGAEDQEDGDSSSSSKSGNGSNHGGKKQNKKQNKGASKGGAAGEKEEEDNGESDSDGDDGSSGSSGGGSGSQKQHKHGNKKAKKQYKQAVKDAAGDYDSSSGEDEDGEEVDQDAAGGSSKQYSNKKQYKNGDSGKKKQYKGTADQDSAADDDSEAEYKESGQDDWASDWGDLDDDSGSANSGGSAAKGYKPAKKHNHSSSSSKKYNSAKHQQEEEEEAEDGEQQQEGEEEGADSGEEDSSSSGGSGGNGASGTAKKYKSSKGGSDSSSKKYSSKKQHKGSGASKADADKEEEEEGEEDDSSSGGADSEEDDVADDADAAATYKKQKKKKYSGSAKRYTSKQQHKAGGSSPGGQQVGEPEDSEDPGADGGDEAVHAEEEEEEDEEEEQQHDKKGHKQQTTGKKGTNKGNSNSNKGYSQPKAKGKGKKQPAASIHQRVDIAEIDAMAETNPYRILMLMAWIDMMACKDLQDPYGYWPLAGVHGLNWPYQGHKPGKHGFCKHGSPAFAGWHRPYVWTFEQGLMQHAAAVAARFKTQKLRQQYAAIAACIRLPYWDFTNPHVPALLRDKSVTVLDASGGYITVSNPLASFKYPKSPGDGISGYTGRSPNWIPGVKRGAGPWAKELASFIRSRDFGCTYNGAARCPGNLEQIHNSIHSTLGSSEGELGKSEYASFDPLFWLLHSAVDRCVWLFQNNNCDGGGWVEPDTYHPFTPPGNPEHVGELGYTYRDPYALTAAAQGASASASSSSSRSRTLLGKIGTNSVPDTVAGPNAGHKVGSPAARAALQRALKQWSGGDSNDYQWQLQFTALRRYQHSKKPANVFVLVKDMPGADPMPSAGKAIGAGGIDPDEVRARPDFCGSIEGFSDDMASANRTRAVSASVDLTDCLQRAGIQTAVEPSNPADEKSGPSRAAVKFSQLKLYALAPDGTDMTPYYDFGPHVVSWTRPLKISAKGGSPVASLMSDALGVKALADGVGVVFSQAVGYM